MKNIITLITLFYCVIINAQTPITNTNFQTAINTCLTTNPVDGLCSSSEYGAMPDWDVSQVTNMREAFYGRTNFNGDIGKWDVSNVINMMDMFRDAIDFNQDIGSWDVSNVTGIGIIGMFLGASDFNQNISGWKVGNVTHIGGMFSGASDFNQNISSWDVSNVINMAGIFNGATAFNQDLSYWCVEKITGIPRDFSRNSALSEANKPVWGTCNTTWKGTTDNNWNTATNWNTGAIPVSASDITIPSGLTNYPTATSAVSFNTMTINSGASFIPQSTATGAVTFNRNLPNTDWYLISPPVSGESVQDVISNHSLAIGTEDTDNRGLASFINTDSNPWNYKSATSTGALSAAQGYSVKLQAAADISFTGNANTSDVNYTVTGGNSNNFYLLGNPFTSYVNSTSFFTKNTAQLSEQTIWLWDGTTYQTYNAVSPIEIAPAQGFFVDIDDNVSNQNIVFETSNQSHQSTDTFKREAAIANFELSIESDDTKSATKVFYVAGKTIGFDNGFDSKIFSGVANSFTVFTELVGDKQGTKLAIQTLDKDDTSIIPVGVIASVGKEITFSLKSENLNEDVSIYLEDKLTRAFINVSETTYKATITEEDQSVGRFYIHTTAASLSTENLNANNISIYKSSSNEITISGLTTEATFKMFSVTGKEVMNTTFKSNSKKEITLPKLAKGVYIVQLTNQTGKVNKKIILE